MNIFANLFSAPKATHTYNVSNGRLAVKADTLDAAYAGQDRLDSANAMYKHATTAKDLAARDGQAADADLRTGHVILPEERFEAHDEVGTFSTFMKLPRGGTIDCQDQVEADGDLTNVTRTYEGFFSKAVDANGQLDSSAGTFTLTAAPEKSKNKRFESWGETTFPLGADGRATLSQPESLKEYEDGEAQQGTVDRINDLIDAASIWRLHGESLDGTSSDVNPAAGETVVPSMSRESLSALLSKEKVLSPLEHGTAQLSDPRWAYRSFGVEVSPNHFVADAIGSRPGPRLTGKTEGDITTIRLEDRSSAESLIISRANGTISYETYRQI